jgi:TonB family protein
LKTVSTLAVLCGVLAATGCRSAGSSIASAASAETVATAPQLLNGEQVEQAIATEYPAELRRDGTGGTVRLRLLVGTDGIPAEVRLLESSGYPILDAAAARVATYLRFSPATNTAGNPLRVWASFPIVFRAP